VGNFSEAIKYLTPLVAIPAWAVRALVALGENWQQLRQFDRSLEFYEQAIALIDHDNPAEHGLKAWYRGAVLAEAMGRPGQARDWLARLVAADAGYKDAAARLVKLQAVCDKGGFPAEPAPSESAQLAAGNEVSEAISEDDLRTAGRDFHANHE
jgi:tetratricopeptide (TPR) repeat protein